MKYRSRMDISAAILHVALGGAIKTRIMYSAFISFPQLKEYLEMLTDSGLLEHYEKDNNYHTTEKGRYFLKLYKEVGQILTPSQNRKAVLLYDEPE